MRPTVFHMPILVRYDKKQPTNEQTVLELAGKSVGKLLYQHLCVKNSWPILTLLDLWATDYEMRKICRRVPVRQWKKLFSNLQPNIGDTSILLAKENMQVVVCLPTNQLPDFIYKCQMANTQFGQIKNTVKSSLLLDCPQMILGVNPHVNLSSGKLCAQVGHAVHKVFLDPEKKPWLDRWAATDFSITVHYPTKTDWDIKFADAEIKVFDNGHTEIAPGTQTVSAILC